MYTTMRSLIIKDIWTTIQPYMFPDKKRASNYSSYTDGLAAIQNRYTKLVRHVLAGTYPKTDPLYFKFDKGKIGRVTLIDGKVTYCVHSLYARTVKHDDPNLYENTVGSYTMEPQSKQCKKFRTYIDTCLKESYKKRAKAQNCEPIIDFDTYSGKIEHAIMNDRLSVVHKIFQSKTFGNREYIWKNPLGKLTLQFIRYFYHYDGITDHALKFLDLHSRRFPSMSEEKQEIVLRIICWYACRNRIGIPDHPPFSPVDEMELMSMCLSPKIDRNMREYNKLTVVLNMYDLVYLPAFSEQQWRYLLNRYRNGNDFLWETIRSLCIQLNPPCVKIEDTVDMSVGIISPRLRKLIKICLHEGYCGDVLEKIDTDIQQQLVANSLDKELFEVDMRKLVVYTLRTLDLYHIHSAIISLNWLEKHKPRWLNRI